MKQKGSLGLMGWLAIGIATSGPVWADGAGQRETLALQACLSDRSEAEHLCFDVPFYTCMGEQLAVAANPELAEERCLFQEMFVWDQLIEEGCDDLRSLFDEATTEWDAVCFNNNSVNWGAFTREIEQPDWDRGFPNHSLRLSAESTRSFAVQLRILIAAYRNNR